VLTSDEWKAHTMRRGTLITVAAVMLAGVTAGCTSTSTATADLPPATVAARATATSSPHATITPTPTPTPTPTAAPSPAPVAAAPIWERYGTLSSAYTDVITADYLAALAPTICADITAAHIDDGFTHGIMTGGSAQLGYIRPTTEGVWMTISAIRTGCPDQEATFVALLDAYDTAHAADY